MSRESWLAVKQTKSGEATEGSIGFFRIIEDGKQRFLCYFLTRLSCS